MLLRAIFAPGLQHDPVIQLHYKVREEWCEIGRGSIELALKCNGDDSELLLSLRDAGEGRGCELGD